MKTSITLNLVNTYSKPNSHFLLFLVPRLPHEHISAQEDDVRLDGPTCVPRNTSGYPTMSTTPQPGHQANPFHYAHSGPPNGTPFQTAPTQVPTPAQNKQYNGPAPAAAAAAATATGTATATATVSIQDPDNVGK